MNILSKLFSSFYRCFHYVSSWGKDAFYSIKDYPQYTETNPIWQNIGKSFNDLWRAHSNQPNESNTTIMVEGFMSASGPNYLYRTCLHANAVRDSLGGGNIKVVFDEFRFKFRREEWLFKNAGCTDFFYLKRSPLNLWFTAMALFESMLIWKKISIAEDILSLSFDDICFGDLLYDEILKYDQSSKTISQLEGKYFFSIVRAVLLIKKYKHFVKKCRISYYIATHPSYLQYGIMCRAAMSSGAILLLTTDIEASVIDKKVDSNSGWSPVYHEYVSDYIKNKLAVTSDNEETLATSTKYLKGRFNGDIDQVDVKLAFNNKRKYKRTELNSGNKRIGFILAHIFSDNPHCSRNMLYKDYQTWLTESLKLCAENKNINWFVKPHPAADVYGEVGMVEREVELLNADNVVLCPSDLNTASLQDCADVILTMQGTAGLEFSCAGIPIILAGTPFYSGLGFTEDCLTIYEYEKTIQRAHTIPHLSEDKIAIAYRVLGAYQSFVITNNLVFDSDLLAKIWGYKKSTNGEVLKTFSERLSNLDIKMEPQYQRVLHELSMRKES